jgi:hypothetical protein
VEEVYILGATLLASPSGPQRDRRDAPDEESLCEPARLYGCVWEGQGHIGGKTGPTVYEKMRQPASREGR